MGWNHIAIIVFGIMVILFAILGVMKISKKRDTAESKADEEHQQDLTDLPKTVSHSYPDLEPEPKVLVPGVNSVIVDSVTPQEIADNPLPEPTTPPIDKPNKPIRKHKKKVRHDV